MAKSKGRRLAEWLRNLDSNSKASSDTLADDSVSTAKLQTDAVTNPKIADGAVHTANLADQNVTFAKLHTALVVTESDAISSNDNDTTIATSAAIKDYVDTQVAGKDNTDEITEGTTNLYFTNERVDDRVSSLLTAGTGITLTYDDTANTLTVAGAAQYGDSDVSAHLNTSTASSGEYLSWNGSDFDWATIPAGYTDSDARSALSVTQNSAGTAALTYNSSTGVFTYTPPNLSSYLTSYTETDTLDSVTGRGNSTSNSITVGNATITGNLTVQGTTTTLDTATLNVEDKNITINYSTGDSSGSANGAGITIQDAVNSTTDATILWDTTNDEFDFSHAINVTGTVTATGGSSTNWNTAYGWGNHASAGYLTSFDITTQTDPKYLRSNADDTGTNITLSSLILGDATLSHSTSHTWKTLTIQNAGDNNEASIHGLDSTGTQQFLIYGGSGSQGFLSSAYAWRFKVPVSGSLNRDNAYTLWDSGNDGSGSGLDADLLDGQQGSYYQPVSAQIMQYRGTITSQDWNTFVDGTEAGIYGVVNMTGSNKPSAYTYGIQLNASVSGQAKFQLYAPHNGSEGNSLWYRTGWNTDYDAWAKIWDSANDGSGSGLDADTVDGIQASGFVNQNGTYTLASGYTVAQGDWGLRNTTPFGWIQFGPANTTYAHIYTDRGSFYFNVPTLYASGNLMWTSANDGSGSGLDADTLDGSHASSFMLSSGMPNNTDVYMNFRVMRNSNTSSLNDGMYIGYGNSNSGPTRIYGGGSTTTHLYIANTGISFNGSTVWHAGNDGSGSGLDADTVDGIQGASFLRSDANDTATGNITFSGNVLSNGNGSGDNWLPYTDGNFYFRADCIFDNTVDFNSTFSAQNATFDAGTSTTIDVKCDNGGTALVRATGDAQGTGAFEVGQSTAYGGGFSYNGDGSPAWVTGETADHITFYRLDNGARIEVFHYPYNSNVVNFNSTPTVGGSAIWHAGNDGSGSGLDADTVDGIQGGSFLRSDADDTWSGNISTTSSNGIRFGNANQSDTNDGYIAAGKFNSGLNIVGTQTVAGTGRQVRIWGSVITDSGNGFWHAGNDGSGSGLDADLLDGYQGSNYIGLNGNSYYQLTTWLQSTGTHGFYSPSSGAGTHFYPAGLGNYGSFSCEGRKGGWGGYAIEGRVVFMHNGSTASGIYNDVNNHWLFYAINGDKTAMYHNGSEKIYTYASGGRVTGNWLATGDVYAYYSDERLKIKTGKVENAIEKVKEIETFYYTHNEKAIELGYEGTEQQIGVSAQSVEKVLPEVVHLAPIDDDGEGNSVSGEEYKTVNYGRLVPLLIEAIKEQQAQIEELKEKLK